MSKKNIVIISIVGTVLIFLGILITVVGIIQENKKESQNKKEEILSSYRHFKENTDKFIDVRKNYYEVVVDDLYNESVKEGYKIWIKELKSYQELVDKIIDTGSPLERLCINQIHTDQEVINDCNAFVINYETAINYFVKDVDDFNSFIQNYLDNYVTEETNVKKYQINTDKYHYIDINDDGNFIGKS